MLDTIIKRDGRQMPFDQDKITDAIMKAFSATGNLNAKQTARELTSQVVAVIEDGGSSGLPTVEGVQDAVERVLIENGFVRTAKSYILYRAERSRAREMNTRLMQIYEDITFSAAIDSDIKRENANINGDTAMGAMLKYGAEGAKQFNQMFVLKPEHARAHQEGDIHIHDMDFLTLTTTCCQIDLIKLFSGGFSTGHGVLREPNDIASYSALACIAIQA
ncbi:MAG: anaerobic ribonucleoside-triphosphate reductase, partial [Christensenellaceae bacterium]|nr:anaerobic ribonucleoside-triphosphate reductase [Christensenellaceae bacterium]